MSKSITADMKTVDENLLDSDLLYRYDFLADFIEFSPDDIATIHGVSPHLVAGLPAIVDRVYVKMLEFDITRAALVPRHHEYKGDLAPDVEHMTAEDAQILFRKERLIEYFTHLFTAEFDETTASYMDAVGKMHTTKGGSASIHTPLVLINIMLGYIQDLVTEAVLGLDIDAEAKERVVRAINKMLWIQQSFISLQYV